MSAKKITKKQAEEREYIINFRREVMKVPRHKRTPKAVKAVKEFIAQHMRIPERDLKKVKIDRWLNQELWFRGIKSPVTRIKVKAKYEGENVRVELAELPDKLKFAKAREEKRKTEAEKVKKTKEPEKKEPETAKTEDEKKEEQEKEQATAEAGIKAAEIQAKQVKQMKKDISPKAVHRKALQK